MRTLAAILMAMLVCACGRLERALIAPPQPSAAFRYLELVAEERFSQLGEWRGYEDGAELFLGAVDGVFRIRFQGRQFVWTQNDARYRDIVAQAETRQLSDYNHNAFGLACRLDPGNRGRGYYFLISGDGYASIRYSDGRALEAIVAATPSPHIRTGMSRNRLRVVCLDDYLALWVNGVFVAEARDDRAEAGAVGLVGVMNYAGRQLDVAFDDLKIWRATLDER